MKPITRILLPVTLVFAGASISFAGGIVDINQVPGSALGQYGLVIGGTNANHFSGTSDSPINGNIAFGGSSYQAPQFSGDTVTGEVDFSGSNPCTGNGLCGATSISGGTQGGISNAAQAVSDATSLFGTYSTQSGISLASNQGTLNVPTNGTGNYGANEYIYNATTSLTDLIVNAPNRDYVIINITGSGYHADSITLEGGITDDHVLIDVNTTGNFQATGATLDGIIIDGNSSGYCGLDGVTVNGRLYCSTTNNNAQFVSNAVLNAPPNDVVTSTPEPSSFTLMFCAIVLFAVGLIRRSVDTPEAKS